MSRRLVLAAVALVTAVALQVLFAAFDLGPTARWTFYAVALVVLIVLGTIYTRRQQAARSGGLDREPRRKQRR